MPVHFPHVIESFTSRIKRTSPTLNQGNILVSFLVLVVSSTKNKIGQ
uniref:Uncharacterized protein n=1 Tax=Bartonella rochalimae ATCC BAA-1498 TaxID=685782 RepID=E6YM49_9HYPH|nr:hypothetical protein BARRO_50300 [Bartonella rochalimae ATCC BAA-1498]